MVLKSACRLGRSVWCLPALDDGDDDASRCLQQDVVTLADHTDHVVRRLKESLACLPLVDVELALLVAAQLHDLGKADDRFQALLSQTNRTDIWLTTARGVVPLLAKSAAAPATPDSQRRANLRAQLPSGFRHEMLSLQIAEKHCDLPDDPGLRELTLHLIASHHGHAAPFAPVVFDTSPPSIEIDGVAISGADRVACPPHRLDSGVADRFWRLVRRHGWWGLAYLEAVVRLADQQASAAEDRPGEDTPSAKNQVEPAGSTQ